MIFLLSFYTNMRAFAALDQEGRNGLVERHVHYHEEVLPKHARVVSSRGLEPPFEAVTVRPLDGEATARPGPAAETAEALMGVYLIDCRDRDHAVELASMYPMPEGLGCIEVRPAVQDWEYAPSIDTEASPEAVWALCADPASWPEWKFSVRDVDLDPPIRPGRSGVLTTEGGRQLPLRIREVREGESYAFEVDLAEDVTLPLTVSVAPREDGGSRITQRVVMPRAALDLRGLDFSPQFNAGMQATLEALADRAAALDGGRQGT